MNTVGHIVRRNTQQEKSNAAQMKKDLQRLQSIKGGPMTEEMRMMMAHCGNLFLDPATIAETTHRFACLELVHDQQAFSAGATMEALTKPPLLLY